MAIEIHPVPAFQDNYIWFIQQTDNDSVAIVDPGDAEPVMHALQQRQLRPLAILITHHHGDHVGGVRQLRARYPELTVYGPATEAVSLVDIPLREGDSVEPPGLGQAFTVWDVPGHTAGHIAYLTPGAIFCGDTVFAGGCGRVFDGTHEQLFRSLARIRELPAQTQVYCAHEYTLDNLGFAAWVEPENPDIAERTRRCRAARDAGQSTVPSQISEERKTNPFLRFDEPVVMEAAKRFTGREQLDDCETFTAIRRWKDTEYD